MQNVELVFQKTSLNSIFFSFALVHKLLYLAQSLFCGNNFLHYVFCTYKSIKYQS